MNKKNIKKIIVICMSIIVAVAGSSIIVKALIDETNSVRIDASEIEDSTMIIGTHLIYLGSMSDSIYDVAQKSAEQSSQYNIYYKSELANGAWFDITDASSLDDITTSGVPVSDEVIEKLNMTHHTKSDGITYDLVTGKAVSVFDIYSPYELEGLEELSPLKLQYDNIEANEEKSDTDKRNIQLIRDFYSLDFTDDNTKICDENLKALQEYYEILKRDDAEASMSDMVQNVMEKIDAQRRAQIFSNIQLEAIDNLIRAISRNKIYEKKDILGSDTSGEIIKDENTVTEDSEEEEEETVPKIDGFVVDDNLLTSLSEVVANIEESYNEYLNKMLDEGTTVLSKTEYDEIVKLIDFAKADDFASCDEQIKKLNYIDSLNNGIIKNPNEELEYIKTTLMPKSSDEFYRAVSMGAGAEYKALPSTAASATKQTTLKNQQSDIEKIRTEFQFIIQARIDRMETEDSIAYLKELIDGSNYYMNGIKDDDFYSYAKSSVDSYVQWLNEKLSSVSSKLSSGEMDALQAKKEELREEKLEALDKNDLAKAKEIDAQIEVVDKQISDLETKLNNIINSPTASEAEKAAAKATLGSGTASSAINSMLNEVLSEIKDGQLEGVESKLEAISSFSDTNPQSVINALEDIYAALSSERFMDSVNSEKLDELLEKTESLAEDVAPYTSELTDSDMSKIIADYFDIDISSLSETSSGSSSGSGNESSSGTSSGSGSKNPLDCLLGGNSELLSKEEQGQALAALAMYYNDTGSEMAKKALSRYSEVLKNENNPYVYDNYKQDTMNDYIPLDKLAKIIGYRYIFNDSQKEVVLQKGSNYYKFSAFSTRIVRPGENMDEIEIAVGYQKTLYVYKKYAEDTFGIEIINIPNTDSSVILSKDSMDKAGELYDYLVEVGGQK